MNDVAQRVRRSVLVVDDDPRSLKLMSIVLDRAGYDVATARDGASALEVLPELRPALVLVDLLMPGIDGLEFCRRARARASDDGPRLVLFTAMASAEVNVAARAAGVDAVLVKPFDRTALLRDIAGLLA